VAGDRLSRLSFAEPLESEFRNRFIRQYQDGSKPAVFLAALLFSVWAVLDWRWVPGGLFQPAIWIKLGVIVPGLLAQLLAPTLERFGAQPQRVAVICASCVSSGIGGLLLYLSGSQLSIIVPAIHAVTVYLYLLSGLRLLPAIACALPLSVTLQWASGRLGVPAADAAFSGAFLLLTNAFCSIATYRVEYLARSNFLEREVANVLNGNDATTGIPNRLSFERQFQLLSRQIAREGGSVTLLIAEVDHFADYAQTKGPRASSVDLRRIAHAIVHSVRRPLDFAARIEDARFGILLHNVKPEDLQQVMRLIRETVTLLDLERLDSNGPSVLSLTIGAAVAAPGAPPELAMLRLVAEAALDEAREPENQGMATRTAAGGQIDDRVMTGPWGAAGRQSGG